MIYDGKRMSGSDILNIFGWRPITLKSKEGLALLNGTQFMSANGIKALIDGWKMVKCFDCLPPSVWRHSTAASTRSCRAYSRFARIRGQAKTAFIIRHILKDSEIINSSNKAVQDPYSFRCIPQVHGAIRDCMNYVTSVIHTEVNSVTDNPTVFPARDLVVSGGNFHGEPLALVFDYMGVALAELGNISERRVAQLILGVRGLPEFLVAHPGLNSGFMIPQYAAASVVSQNKMYAWPASCDSIVSSNGRRIW